MKHRSLRTFEHAITAVLGALTPDGAAEAVGKSASLCYKWGDMDSDVLPNLKQALAMDVAFVREGNGDAPILGMYASLLEAATQETVAKPAGCLKDSVLHVHSRVGELSASVVEALKSCGDGGEQITYNEYVELEKHITAVRGLCDQMERAVFEARLRAEKGGVA